MDNKVLFTGGSNPQLATKVAENLNANLGAIKVGTFSDGEINVEITENVRGKDTFVIQSTNFPAEKNLMELILIIDALKGHRLDQSQQLFRTLVTQDKIEELGLPEYQ